MIVGKDHCPVPIRSVKKKQSKSEGRIRGEDRISELPDDILVRILSLLTTEESVRCSALSHRWAPLPKLVPMKLKFVKRFYESRYQQLRKIELSKFIRRVNQAVDSYRGETLDEFSICFGLNNYDYDKCHIDKWVQFAMANKVKKLELDLSGFDTMKTYQFPSLLYDKRLRSRHIGLPSCTSLTALRLDKVNVPGEQIERFLECCPFLESLCVISSGTLTSLKVDGPVHLKLLEIMCNSLAIFEISAPNLISLKCSTYVMRSMKLRAPQLSEISIGHGFCSFLVGNIHQFECHLALIETLSLTDCCYMFPARHQEVKWPIEIPTLSNLKELKIIVTPYFIDCVICSTPWIKASPLLRRFVVERIGGSSLVKCLKPIVTIEGVHRHLKEFEFVGFEGDEADTKLVLYVIEKAVNLDKIVIDCRYPSLFAEKETISMAKDRARKFQSSISPTVEFVLLP